MDNNELKSTNKLLRVIVALLLRRKDEQLLTLRQQIKILEQNVAAEKEGIQKLTKEKMSMEVEF